MSFDTKSISDGYKNRCDDDFFWVDTLVGNPILRSAYEHLISIEKKESSLLTPIGLILVKTKFELDD